MLGAVRDCCALVLMIVISIEASDSEVSIYVNTEIEAISCEVYLSSLAATQSKLLGLRQPISQLYLSLTFTPSLCHRVSVAVAEPLPLHLKERLSHCPTI